MPREGTQPVTGSSQTHVVMFSSGAASAVAAKRVAEKYGTADLVLLFADVNGEHGDNYRFLQEAAQWIGGRLVVLDNDGRTIWQVFAEARFLGNSRVDPCSRVLKREPTRRWLEQNCEVDRTTIYLGFDWTEEHRHVRATDHWKPWQVESPLLWEPQLDKREVLDCLVNEEILPPFLTRLGFPHANCGGGCVKAGIAHFKRLLSVAPDTFAWWEWNEERVRRQLQRDVSILVTRRDGETRPLTLRALRVAVESNATLFSNEDWGGCGCFTPTAESDDT